MFYFLFLSTYTPPALGLGLLVAMFSLCAILVLGVKSLYLFIKQKFFPSPVIIEPVKPPRKKRKPLRTIEINPDEVDRVYFKKIS